MSGKSWVSQEREVLTAFISVAVFSVVGWESVWVEKSCPRGVEQHYNHDCDDVHRPFHLVYQALKEIEWLSNDLEGDDGTQSLPEEVYKWVVLYS